MLLSITSFVNLLWLSVVIYLLLTLALQSVFLTKFLTSSILFLTVVNAEFVTKPLILGISLSISVILKL